MEKVQRKITYRMYPNATQDVALKETLALHCRVYNTLLKNTAAAMRRASRFILTSLCAAT
jgi:putative transposase